MKTYVLVFIIGLLSISCNAQDKNAKHTDSADTEAKIIEPHKGSWKVNKEFDDAGNLIRYDSIYSWSSTKKLDKLSLTEKDSLLQTFKSRFFRNFSDFDTKNFEDVFSKDSLFSKHYFNDEFFGSDFGRDFMDIDKITQQMIARQKKFLEKYQSEFLKPKDEN